MPGRIATTPTLIVPAQSVSAKRIMQPGNAPAAAPMHRCTECEGGIAGKLAGKLPLSGSRPGGAFSSVPPTAHIVHALPGRMRLRIPSRRGDTPYFTSLVEQLSEHPSIHELRADPHSAGLVIHHGGLANAVLALAAEADLFITGESEIASIKHPPPVLLDATAAALSGLSVTQALRGEFLGSAAENFSNAYGSVRVLQRPGLAAIFGALGVLQLMRGEFLGSATSLLFYGYLARKIAEDMRQAERIAGEPAHDMPSA